MRLAKRLRLPRQNDENRLRNFLRRVRVAGAAQRGGINQIDVPLDERGEGRFGMLSAYSFSRAMSSGSGIYQ